MKKALHFIFCATLLFSFPQHGFSWGKKGHEMVADVAKHFLDNNTYQIVKRYLGGYNFEEAGTWMDDNRSNNYYDFQKPWHYCDVDKGFDYKPTTEKNMLTVLNTAIAELKNHDKMKAKDIKNDILYIFHLMGDLHQPLHCGYTADKGGNMIDISSDWVSGNLHSVWDTQIIDADNIQLNDCISLYDSLSTSEIAQIKQFSLLSWYKQSRSYLDFVYDFQNGFLDKNYIDKSAVIIKKQILRGGLRLATILTDLFKNDKTDGAYKEDGFGDYFYHYNYIGLAPVTYSEDDGC